MTIPIKITHGKSTKYYYAPSTLTTKWGADVMKNVLGLTVSLELSRPAERRVAAVNQNASTSRELENSTPQGVVDATRRLSNNIGELESLIHDADRDFTTDNLMLRDRIRDIIASRGAYEETARQIKLVQHKMTTLKEQIKRVKAYRKTVIRNNKNVTALDNRIEELREQYEAQNKLFKNKFIPDIASEFKKIRKTTDALLYANKTLFEKLKTLFRTRGITISTTLIALGFFIDYIVRKATGAGKTAPKPTPGPEPGPEPGPTPSLLAPLWPDSPEAILPECVVNQLQAQKVGLKKC